MTLISQVSNLSQIVNHRQRSAEAAECHDEQDDHVYAEKSLQNGVVLASLRRVENVFKATRDLFFGLLLWSLIGYFFSLNRNYWIWGYFNILQGLCFGLQKMELFPYDNGQGEKE
ncbi:LOW QUALITY PROTEIN: hypothetical protein PanWU01x14_232920 [Parasponia andersonii]|uniref:Uncharacterized protein n=1 Tax=Parasponia andersonii TaxID=3476 RepID=A0A2P5BJT1_PARAD|nr:LOW QUALITY PROTEIN: hypothetical protein PanWU01x14_232920 [Parasponia andersonii]